MVVERRKKLENELSRIVRILREEYDPEKILLFGSMVTGRTRSWSDIDLVVIKTTQKRFVERLREVALLADPRVGMDFFVYTPEEFEAMTSERNTFQRTEMVEKGKVLYERD